MFNIYIKALIFCVLQTAMDRHLLWREDRLLIRSHSTGKTGLRPMHTVDSLVRIAIAG